MAESYKYTVEKFIEAVRGSGGIKLAIARALGCNRNTIDHYLRRFVSAREAYDQEVQTLGDQAESVVINAIRRGDIDTAKWYARVKLRDRGYGDQLDVVWREEATRLATAYGLDAQRIIDLAIERKKRAG